MLLRNIMSVCVFFISSFRLGSNLLVVTEGRVKIRFKLGFRVVLNEIFGFEGYIWREQESSCDVKGYRASFCEKE